MVQNSSKMLGAGKYAIILLDGGKETNILHDAERVNLQIIIWLNPLAAMAYQFPCAEPIYCNFMLN